MNLIQRENLLHIKCYIRIPDHKLNSEQLKIIKLDRANKHSLIELEDIGISQGNMWKNKPEIKNFFNEKSFNWKFKCK